jgi:hypothetical protein
MIVGLKINGLRHDVDFVLLQLYLSSADPVITVKFMTRIERCGYRVAEASPSTWGRVAAAEA